MEPDGQGADVVPEPEVQLDVPDAIPAGFRLRIDGVSYTFLPKIHRFLPVLRRKNPKPVLPARSPDRRMSDFPFKINGLNVLWQALAIGVCTSLQQWRRPLHGKRKSINGGNAGL